MKIISWNMKQKHDSWRRLLEMDIDLALLQEAGKPPPDVAKQIQDDPAIEIDSAPWRTTTAGGSTSFRTAIAKLSDRIEVEWIEAKSPGTADSRDLVVSWPGTLTAARVKPASGAPVLAVSMYAQWLGTHSLAANNFIFADSSVHHVISDLSVFVTKADGHRVLAAGDLNILRGYGEHGDAYWAARYQRPLPANWITSSPPEDSLTRLPCVPSTSRKNGGRAIIAGSRLNSGNRQSKQPVRPWAGVASPASRKN